MAGICKCSGNGCPMASTCRRYLVEASEMQSYFTEVPVDKHGKCKYYWEVKDEERK